MTLEFSLKIQELKKMILERFDNDLPKYYEWSLEIRQMVNNSAENISFVMKTYFSVVKRQKKHWKMKNLQIRMTLCKTGN